MELAATRAVQVDLNLLTLFTSLVIPLVTGLVTKKLASSQVKALVTTGLSVLAGALGAVVQNNGSIPDLGAFVNSTVMAFVVATASYYGLWRPTGAAVVVQNVAPGVGLGTATVQEPAQTIAALTELRDLPDLPAEPVVAESVDPPAEPPVEPPLPPT